MKLQQKLELIPDPNASIPINQPDNVKYLNQSPMTLQEINNRKIIQQKNNDPIFNKRLLTPSNQFIPVQYNINNLSNHTIRIKQRDDPLLFPIITYLRDNNQFLISHLPSYQQRIIYSGRYHINGKGLLCYQHGFTSCIVIPSFLQSSVLRWAHGEVHHGAQKVFDRIVTQQHFWWTGIRNSIREYVKICHGCQQVKRDNQRPHKSGQIKTFSATAPFELVSIDICGPLPETDNGNRYIVSMIDKFSRYCLLIPIQDITALSVLKAYNRWINTFGPPTYLLSDNGSQFVSAVFKDFNEEIGTKPRFITPYHAAGNGQVERIHRWIKERLVLISIDSGQNFLNGDDNWDDYLSIIQHAYNSTPNTMTKYSPNKIIFGSDFKSNIDRINDETNKTTASSQLPVDYVKYMDNQRRIIYEDANTNQYKYDQIRSKSYNKKRIKSHKYEIGDLIMINWSNRLTGNKKKLSPTWQGPYEIIKVITENKAYEAREVGNEGNIQKINVKFMKPYIKSPYIAVLDALFQNQEYFLNGERNDKIVKYITKQTSRSHCINIKTAS